MQFNMGRLKHTHFASNGIGQQNGTVLHELHDTREPVRSQNSSFVRHHRTLSIFSHKNIRVTPTSPSHSDQQQQQQQPWG